MTKPANKRLRFGTFEFDPLTRELWRDGAAVKLQAQPAALLAALLARAGVVVTRASLREAVWGTETHVDFESGLNFCVAQLRSALGDSAESPVYIRTVPKRGYQFIAPVTGNAAAVPSPKPGVSWRRALFPVLTAFMVCVAGWYAWSQMPASSRSRVRIAVTRFENQSGDPALDRFSDGLSDAVVAEFTAVSAGVEVIGNAAILRAPRDRQDLARIGAELKANFVVLGQVQHASQRGTVLLHLIRLPDQSHLWVTRIENPDLADPLTTQKEIARRAVREFSSKLRR